MWAYRPRAETGRPRARRTGHSEIQRAAANASRAPGGAARLRPQGPLGRPTALLVEDDSDTLETFATVLREEFRVFVARNGAHALAVSEELGWHADIIVVDLNLGEGLRGDQFVERYREHTTYRTPVIVVSGSRHLYERARGIRPQAILDKPVDINELLRKVNLYVRARPS